MSYTTTADHNITQAREKLREAIQHLSELVVNSCDGAEEYKPETLARWRASLVILIEQQGQIE